MVTVSASMYAVNGHENRLLPPRSPTILGRLVPTTVWSSEAISIPRLGPSR